MVDVGPGVEVKEGDVFFFNCRRDRFSISGLLYAALRDSIQILVSWYSRYSLCVVGGIGDWRRVMTMHDV